MNPMREITALLQALQRLYAGMALRALQKRMGAYRREGGAIADHDLTALLSDHVDKLAAVNRDQSSELAGQPAGRKGQKAQLQALGNHHVSARQVTMLGRAFTELGRYFRSSRRPPVLDPELSQKLRNSTWEHIHTALRLARQGQARTAKLHLNIASQALKEVAHYMSKEDYIAFTVEIEKKLADITVHDTETGLPPGSL
jgi:hypothetical protein